jgi:two-component system response regulator AtoC
LENVIERAMVMAEGEVLDLAAFSGLRVGPAKGDTGLSIKRGVRALEVDLIQRALQHTHGNRTRAAALLEISHRALLYKLKEYGLGGRGRETEPDLDPESAPPQPVNEP